MIERFAVGLLLETDYDEVAAETVEGGGEEEEGSKA
jgi:hypothetical protein